jgi:hypothetical protein
MDSIIEYSMNTPINQENILNSKIITMLKKSNQQIGGDGTNLYPMTNCIVMIVGIIVIIIGFYLCWNKNDFTSVTGQIQNLSCDSDINSYTNFYTNSYINSQCKFNVTYTVANTQYSKVITLDKLSAPNSSTNTITVYYKESDPNIMRLYNFNYSVIGIILIIIGAFVLISSICCSDNINLIQSDNKTQTESNLYSESKNINGVLYTKM